MWATHYDIDRNKDGKASHTIVFGLFSFSLLIAIIFVTLWGLDKRSAQNYIHSNCTVVSHNVTHTTCGRFADPCYKASISLYSIKSYIGNVLISKFSTASIANDYLNKKYPINSTISCYYNKHNYDNIVLSSLNNNWLLGIWVTFISISVLGPLIFVLIYYKEKIMEKCCYCCYCCKRRNYETLQFF